MVTKNKFQLYLVSRQFGMPDPWIWNFTNCLGYKTKVKMLVIDLELYELSWIQNRLVSLIWNFTNYLGYKTMRKKM